MDQYISAMGSKGNLLLIDCRSNKFDLVPYITEATRGPSPLILITNSMVKHNLSDSEYPVRVQQCQDAVSLLKTSYPEVKTLRDVSLSMLDSISDKMDDITYRRAKHVVTEDIRTLNAVAALREGDYKTVGLNMTASHRSLQKDYEVSCEELDLLVDIAEKVPGVYGSRMTGGGFGGCTVTLVDRTAVELLEMTLSENYLKLHGMKCQFYRTEPAEGAAFMRFSNLPPVMQKATSTSGNDTTRADGDEKERRPKLPSRPVWLDWVVPVCVLVVAGAVVYLRRK